MRHCLPSAPPRRAGSRPRALAAPALLVAALLLASLPGDAAAHGSCTAVRMKNAGKRCRAITRCYIREAQGREDLAPCVAHELQRLERHFQETLIYPDCHPFGDPPDVIAALQAAMGSVATQLQLSTDRCSRTKMDAAGRVCLHLLRDCEAPAEVDDVPVDPACEADAATLLERLYGKAETTGGCTTTGDDAVVVPLVAAGVDATVTELDVP